MSVYSIKTKKRKQTVITGWRYDFQVKGERYQSQIYNTKSEAQEAEQKKKQELRQPKRTDIIFLELIELWLDDKKIYNATSHYKDCVYLARRWVREWGTMPCSQITENILKSWIQKRGENSPHTGNKERKILHALFSWGCKQNPPLLQENPVANIPLIPINEKRKFVKYVPPVEDIIKVLWVASRSDNKKWGDILDYLYTIWDTKGRKGEIDRLEWEDIHFYLDGLEPWKKSWIVLYTRKKKGGNLTPREVPMTKRLYYALLKKYQGRDKSKPWVFWHRYWSRKNKCFIEGPYGDRKRIMKTLCDAAGVKYFRFHALRHSGASIMASDGHVSIRSIQKILGHENVSTTEIYLHSLGEAERIAMDSFEEKTGQVPHKVPHEEKGDSV